MLGNRVWATFTFLAASLFNKHSLLILTYQYCGNWLGVLSVQETAEMTATGLYDSNYTLTTGTGSVEQHESPWTDFSTSAAAANTCIYYIALALGIPGNVLAAIVWLRLRENPSASYLAALAISDLVFQVFDVTGRLACRGKESWACRGIEYVSWCADILDLLLVLTFSVIRLIAIRWPLKVDCVTRFQRRRDVIQGGSKTVSCCTVIDILKARQES